MIHPNHLPLDQRREQVRWKCAAVGGSPPRQGLPSGLRSSPAIRSLPGAPSVTHQTPSAPASMFHDPHLTAGQPGRSVHGRNDSAMMFRASFRKKHQPCHNNDDRERITLLFALHAGQFPHQISLRLHL